MNQDDKSKEIEDAERFEQDTRPLIGWLYVIFIAAVAALVFLLTGCSTRKPYVPMTQTETEQSADTVIRLQAQIKTNGL